MMLVFINGLLEKLSFFTQAGSWLHINAALEATIMPEAYGYRQTTATSTTIAAANPYLLESQSSVEHWTHLWTFKAKQTTNLIIRHIINVVLLVTKRRTVIVLEAFQTQINTVSCIASMVMRCTSSKPNSATMNQGATATMETPTIWGKETAITQENIILNAATKPIPSEKNPESQDVIWEHGFNNFCESFDLDKLTVTLILRLMVLCFTWNYSLVTVRYLCYWKQAVPLI